MGWKVIRDDSLIAVNLELGFPFITNEPVDSAPGLHKGTPFAQRSTHHQESEWRRSCQLHSSNDIICRHFYLS